MKFVTHNQKKDININCSSFLASIDVDYAILVKKFGKPTIGDGMKVDAEWLLEFEDGTVASIYNYKNGRNYNGRSASATKKITDWHIGGFNEKAIGLVKGALQ